MRRLLLLRHAKSSWADERHDDFERPLAPRGVRAAEAMADFLAREGLAPELVLCSAARRAVETWRRMAGRLEVKPKGLVEAALYLAGSEALLDRVRRVPDDHATVMLIGHNPGMETLARMLSGSGDRTARRRMAEKFPTAALAVIDFDVARWAELAPGEGRLARFVTPKDL